MSKLKPKHDDYTRSNGLWLPKYGLRGPDRKRPNTRRYMPGYPCCCGGGGGGDPWDDCAICTAGTAPQNYRISLSGIVDNDCSECTDLNDDFTVAYHSNGNADGVAWCLWYYSFPSSICSGSATYPFCGISFAIFKNTSSVTWIIATVNATWPTTPHVTPGLHDLSWRNYGLGYPLDCGFDGISLSDISEGMGVDQCTTSSSTCTATAL